MMTPLGHGLLTQLPKQPEDKNKSNISTLEEHTVEREERILQYSRKQESSRSSLLTKDAAACRTCLSIIHRFNKYVVNGLAIVLGGSNRVVNNLLCFFTDLYTFFWVFCFYWFLVLYIFWMSILFQLYALYIFPLPVKGCLSL